MSEALKRQAAAMALSEVRPGMRLGLGTGSTARHFVDLLGEKVAAGLDVICVPTSEATARQAQELNIPLSDLDTLDRLDLTVDGADEIDPGLNLIKGGGGALLREKIVAAASDAMVVIADASKCVEALGRFPLPIEVNRFGLGATRHAIEQVLTHHGAQGGLKLRGEEAGNPFVTDGGHLILDAFFGRISQPEALSSDLLNIPGVVQHGLFLKMCSKAYVATPNGVEELKRQ
ncbi:ribose-5-phosphate isomerase RpiA [Devosia elaeis]|uniref:Ribose-5-phosphate isomerase A n=1 Tax=Devosia elaeis TaxID=1770058 RepID=A0A178I556_9HYPH|nr:ribose-5-phosphate isomerase RpiA [Devosia elaeis]OAM79315.1 ribose 5-phosphate isomerase A [Devosia elaeis]